MSDLGPGPFAGKSWDEQTAECMRWLADGNRPDAHKAVRPHTDKLPDDFEPMTPVSVQKGWPDTTFIHCNACGNAAKFRDNGHVATAGNGWWYIVGPECGSPEHTARLHQRVNQMRRRHFLSAAEVDVRALATDLPPWRGFMVQLKEVVGVAYRGHKFITTMRPALHALLDAARKGDGWLMVVSTVTEVDVWGDKQERDILVRHTKLDGLPSIAKPCPAVEHFKKAEEILGPMLEQDDALTDEIAKAVASGKQAELHRRLKDGLDRARLAHEAVLEARAFWSASNLRAIATWGIRHDSRYQMTFDHTLKADGLHLVTESNEAWILRDAATLLDYSATLPVAGPRPSAL